jgi:hypothetical protein
MQSDVKEVARKLYGIGDVADCPFTEAEIAEMEQTNEMLVYLPKRITPKQMCDMWGIPANVDFDNERMVKTVMNAEDQWFVTSASSRPELMYISGQQAKRIYEDEGLHGLDLRRYVAFAATYKFLYDELPDKTYWTFLHSGSYDRSGISVVGFDRFGILNHHGWMRNFKAKFAGSRYCVIAPRIEVTRETCNVPRAYRGKPGWQSMEAAMD